MPQKLTERFNKFLNSQKSSKHKPRIFVYHQRGENRAYTGVTVCELAYIDDRTKNINVIRAEASASPSEHRPITKKDGYRIATERAYKQFFKRVKE